MPLAYYFFGCITLVGSELDIFNFSLESAFMC